MRRPHSPETPIDNRRRSAWRMRFEGYRQGVTDAKLDEWLAQFTKSDRRIAARVLDVVEFISAEEIDAAFRSLLARIPGWHRQKAQRRGEFRFAPFSRTAGESGDAMLHRFRLANGLSERYYNPLFIGRSEIPAARLGRDDSLVFVDDFVGSGKQAVDAWTDIFDELSAGVGHVYLLTVASFVTGAQRVQTETRVDLLSHRPLGTRDSLPHTDCSHFSDYEKRRIRHYCNRASPAKPLGFGDCGLVLVLAHQCPNNSLAILHADDNDWMPLFPRS